MKPTRGGGERGSVFGRTNLHSLRPPLVCFLISKHLHMAPTVDYSELTAAFAKTKTTEQLAQHFGGTERGVKARTSGLTIL